MIDSLGKTLERENIRNMILWDEHSWENKSKKDTKIRYHILDLCIRYDSFSVIFRSTKTTENFNVWKLQVWNMGMHALGGASSTMENWRLLGQIGKIKATTLTFE